jgi:hypothetical protein
VSEETNNIAECPGKTNRNDVGDQNRRSGSPLSNTETDRNGILSIN